jgi:hypothetical protein
LRNGIIQALTQLDKDDDYKRFVAEKSLDTVYSAIDEKCGKVAETISKLREIHGKFVELKSNDYESLKFNVDKYNRDVNLVLDGQQTDGQLFGGSKRRRITRRISSSRAFRKTRGRRQSSQ